MTDELHLVDPPHLLKQFPSELKPPPELTEGIDQLKELQKKEDDLIKSD